ncbi:Carboxypeptidase regulatory-like domain-containing protein [Cyclonatronum proteinivorum]|uniref:Carboxypeptidase regulatory-like domain-containing protein n=2 Tax=Cyclonatronum proteinivorum TaxID=1457365 RepID=A0A345UPI2_9BACT|nr:Carboxypeptidase regulatory-like domain-containing protein [Cyclonatronum proteinivorum]
MNMKSFILSVFCLLMIPALAIGQGVTTSTLTGVVTDDTGETLPGANVTAVHVPSGTTFGTTTLMDGSYRISNMRVGGPYTIRISFVGFRTFVVEDVFLRLGETYVQNAELSSEDIELEEFVVTALGDRIFNQERTGASTNVTSDRIASVPTITRSINDLTKLTPQSSGTSFAGRDNRFNNYTIDGNVYNNNFGLGNAQFAAGNPISLDVIEEVQINLAPYDVRQGGFTGANVNAITRSGTNQFRGTGYVFYRNQDFLGTQIGDNEINVEDTFTRTIGASVGGPIIQDRLFFFFNAELEEADNPGDNRLALRPGQTPDGAQITRVPVEQAQFVRDSIRDIYGFDPGRFEDIAFANEALRINARLDFNINQQHRAMVRFNLFDSFVDNFVNGNSIRGFPGSERFRNTNRFGPEALTFRNTHYSTDATVTSIVAELNSSFGNNLANSFRVGNTWSTPQQRSVPGGDVFPMIEIFEPEGGNPNVYYMALGNELFTVGNLLENDTFNIENTLTYFTGRNTITAGASFEYMTFANAFNPVWNSWYRYATYDDFVRSVIEGDTSVRPSHFAIGYTFDVDNPTVLPLDEVSFAQVGLYLQNEFQVNQNLKVTAGLRVDLPFYPIDAPRNEAVEALNLSIPNPRGGANIEPDVSAFPGVNPLWSPRLGFNYDVFGDRSTQVRGGTGLFSGRLPFVWISNQLNANGVTRGQRGYFADDWGTGNAPEWQGFQADPNVYRPDPATLDAEIPSQINLTADDFRLPQVWRTNIAVDQRLPFDMVGTFEFIYSQDYNSPLAVNLANQPTGESVNVAGNAYNTYTQQLPGATGSDLREVYYLTNINKGNYTSVNLGLEKTWDIGLFTSFNYTWSRARDYGLIGGSQAQSLWPDVVFDNRNDPEIGYSRFDTPNRIVAQATYSTNMFTAQFPTNISLIYVGGDQGRYSYTYAGSFGDGSGIRLMYVPRNFEESQLVDLVDGDGNVQLTAAQQWEILDAFIEQDDYLSSNRGSVTERNGAKLPWLHRFDVRVSQDVRFQSHRLQLTFDVLNVGNLLNNTWGVARVPVERNPMVFTGADANGNAQFNIANENLRESFRDNISIASTWSAQVGVRYLFN